MTNPIVKITYDYGSGHTESKLRTDKYDFIVVTYQDGTVRRLNPDEMKIVDNIIAKWGKEYTQRASTVDLLVASVSAALGSTSKEGCDNESH